MTDYALHASTHDLLASWSTGKGLTATIIATTPSGVDDEAGFALARTLTQLSRHLWDRYTTTPAPADPEDHDLPDVTVTTVEEAIRKPNLPQGGYVTMSYDPVEELAHRIGRILHAAATPSLTDMIVNEVRIEFDAVDRAERGDLTGRARQAVELSRDDASPLQVAEADRLLRENPFGPDALLTDVDPTAASVAAAHWLRAAAVTAAQVSGLPWTRVVAESDDIEATNFVTPTAILAALDRGLSPLEAVTTLVRNSKAIARGSAPDLKSLQQLCREVERAQSRSATEMPVEYRMTPLDTRRPARDLLEDLLSGISACLLMYAEYWSPEEEELDEESDEPSPATIAFIDEVRLEAARTRTALD